MLQLRVILLFAKASFFLLALGSVGMALLADEAGPWVFGVFPVTVILATITIAVSRSMKIRAAMRAADEDLNDSSSTEVRAE